MATLYVTDLDGTLVHRGRINEFSVERISAAIERGVLITCATARSWTTARRLLANIQLTLPVVLHNGAVTFDPVTGLPIHISTMDAQIVLRVIEICQREAITPLVNVFDGAEHIFWVADDESKYVRSFWAGRGADPRRAPVARLSQLPIENVIGIAVLGPALRVSRTYKRLGSLDVALAVRRSPNPREGWWLEVSKAGVSKGATVLDLRGHIEFDRIVAFGDDSNDVSLFRVASEAYVVGPAPIALRRVATGRLAGDRGGAVAAWLERHALSADYE